MNDLMDFIHINHLFGSYFGGIFRL